MNKILLLLIGLTFVGLPIPLSAQEEQEMESKLQIVDARLGKNVANREITDETQTFMVGEKAYLWLKVAGGTDDSVTVIWGHGDHKFSTTLAVKANPWRTWAYKTLAMPGDWSVAVTDSEGNVLEEMMFKVEEEMDAPEMKAE